MNPTFNSDGSMNRAAFFVSMVGLGAAAAGLTACGPSALTSVKTNVELPLTDLDSEPVEQVNLSELTDLGKEVNTRMVELRKNGWKIGDPLPDDLLQIVQRDYKLDISTEHKILVNDPSGAKIEFAVYKYLSSESSNATGVNTFRTVDAVKGPDGVLRHKVIKFDGLLGRIDWGGNSFSQYVAMKNMYRAMGLGAFSDNKFVQAMVDGIGVPSSAHLMVDYGGGLSLDLLDPAYLGNNAHRIFGISDKNFKAIITQNNTRTLMAAGQGLFHYDMVKGHNIEIGVLNGSIALLPLILMVVISPQSNRAYFFPNSSIIWNCYRKMQEYHLIHTLCIEK